MSNLDHNTGYFRVYKLADRKWAVKINNLVGCVTAEGGFKTKKAALARAEAWDAELAKAGRLFAD